MSLPLLLEAADPLLPGAAACLVKFCQSLWAGVGGRLPRPERSPWANGCRGQRERLPRAGRVAAGGHAAASGGRPRAAGMGCRERGRVAADGRVAAGGRAALARIGGGPGRIAAAAGSGPCHRARLGLGECPAASLFGAMVASAERVL